MLLGDLSDCPVNGQSVALLVIERRIDFRIHDHHIGVPDLGDQLFQQL